jgi:hypothetical protein
MLPLQYFTFLEAAKAGFKIGDEACARRLIEQARPPGVQLDKKIGGTGRVDSVNAFLARLQTTSASTGQRLSEGVSAGA